VSSVAPYRATVQEFLEQGLETEAIYQRLKEQHGFTGHYQAVWRFVRKLQPQRPDVTVQVDLAPGVEVQVDFGYAGRMFDPVRQRVRKSWAFVGTLSFSRHQYVEFVFDADEFVEAAD
jgi:transposase